MNYAKCNVESETYEWNESTLEEGKQEQLRRSFIGKSRNCRGVILSDEGCTTYEPVGSPQNVALLA